MTDGAQRMLRFTLQKFPATGELKDECGLPFACVAQPFARSRFTSLDRPCELKAKDIARCSECYAYINRYCQLERAGWSCALCGQYNEHLTPQEAKYGRQSAMHRLPELRADLVEMECDPHEGLNDSDSDEEEEVAKSEQPAMPVYVALVDVCCGEETLELTRSALQAAVEALPPAARFGLVTYSHQLGLYEVAPGGGMSVRYVQLLEEDAAPTAMELEDALPLTALLAPVGEAKDAIVAGLDSLQAEPFDSAETGELEQLAGGRSFGGAVQAVLRYLSGAAALQQQNRKGGVAAAPEAAAANGTAASIAGSYAGARLLAFLAGPPNAGRGRVFHRQPQNRDTGQAAGPTASSIIMDPMMSDLNPYTFSMPAIPQPSRLADAEDEGPQPIVIDPEAREFYEEAAAAAASLAVCIDVFAVAEEGCGLAAIEPLAAATGGGMFLYPSPEDAALPQDIYRRLGAPLARGGLLRLRTSPDFRVARAFGHLFPDDQFENLFHIISADPNDCFAFELEYAKASGLNNMEGMSPVLQMVFQYSILLPQPQPPAADSTSQQQCVLQRRMRVLTVPIPLAATPREVFDGCDPDAVLAVLLHKLIQAAGEDGAAEGHALLQDWLSILAAQYNRHILGLSGDTAMQADVAFEAVEALQPVPRLTYGLLRSPLLVRRPDDHPDAATAARLLWAGLPPGELRRAVFPLLSSYSSPEAQAFPQHSLSEAALSTSGAPLFVLDAHTEVLVYHAAGGPQEQPFPPPQGSLLRNAINAARTGRRMTPRLRLLRGGTPADDRAFYACLIEEPDAGLAAAGAEAGRGFVLFLDGIKTAVVGLLRQLPDT